MSREGELADRLEAVLADVDDLSFDQLQQALADGATSRPASDKVLAQVRRAVEKAERLLRQLDAGSSGGGDVA
ncbi:hypothetical protein BH20ACT4_BH20ACT4_05760 [soil metagenome]